MAETTSSPNAASTEAYRAAVSTSLQRLGEHRLRAAIFWEFVVILGMGVTAVIKSLVHWRWWSTANVITAYEVFGDTISPMVGGAVVTLIALVWRWRRKVEKARVAIWATDQETIAQFTKATKGESADDARRVHHALLNLFDAYRELEIVNNRTSDDSWNALSQRLEEYKAAYAELSPIARRFHERSEPALTHFVQAREFERLREVMDDASDIMLYGECELDLNISQPNPSVFTRRPSRRDRFILINMIVANREEQPVSLVPVWHLYVDPGQMHMTYQADAEPLKDWEEYRREVPSTANPPLAVPLHLPPKSSATGYWCFFIGNSMENVKRLQDGHRYVETVLEIHDFVSGRRTKSDRFILEAKLIRPLLSPLPTDDNAEEESQEAGEDSAQPPDLPS